MGREEKPCQATSPVRKGQAAKASPHQGSLLEDGRGAAIKHTEVVLLP